MGSGLCPTRSARTADVMQLAIATAVAASITAASGLPGNTAIFSRSCSGEDRSTVILLGSCGPARKLLVAAGSVASFGASVLISADAVTGSANALVVLKQTPGYK